MTQLFNLESHVDCCQHALLFNESQPLNPKIDQLPYNYKSFIQKYGSLLYAPNIITNEASPQELVIESNQCNYISIGSTLAPGDKQQLFIIRDTVDLLTLSTSNLFTRQDGYLYSSAYHYWNNYSALSQLNKPLVFLDFDSCLPSELIPVDITSIENTTYKIPVLNTGKRFCIDSEFNSQETYQAISAAIARWILENNFPAAQNQEGISHLTQYLQKIAFFRSIQPYVNQDIFEIIVEILHQNQVFYKKVVLSTQAIANIIRSQIKVDLNQLTLQYPGYQFVLVSQYNIFPEFCRLYPTFICPNPLDQQFNEIWQARTQLKFPLFGLYLDKIEFAISVSGSTGKRQEQWIQLANQKDTISFEGKPTILIGSIFDTNQNVFRISSQTTSILPIKVNGAEYRRDGMPQGYSIKVVDADHTADVSIQIEFHLQPGSFPELKVTDIKGKYKFVTDLVDRKKSNYNHISIEKINSDRLQKSINQIKRLQASTQLEELKKILVAIANDLTSSPSSQVPNLANLTHLIKKARQHIHRGNASVDLLQFIDNSSSETSITQLNIHLRSSAYQKIVDILVEKIRISSNRNLSLTEKDFVAEALIFVGKTYKFSQNFSTKSLLSLLKQVRQLNYKNISNEYLQCLARIAVNETYQSEYFGCFNSFYKDEKSKYLWGYSRTLLWYYKFDASVHRLDYKVHFIKILDYLLSKPFNDFKFEYKQNAFLALLYLLTFRATDKTFCQQNSIEMQQASRVIEHFQSDRIVSQFVSREKSLNQFFQEMLEGNSTEDDLDQLVQAN